MKSRRDQGSIRGRLGTSCLFTYPFSGYFLGICEGQGIVRAPEMQRDKPPPTWGCRVGKHRRHTENPMSHSSLW